MGVVETDRVEDRESSSKACEVMTKWFIVFFCQDSKSENKLENDVSR